MRRWAFNFVVAVALLLGLAAMAFWVRSRWSTDMVCFTVGPAFVQVCSQDGTLYVEANTDCRPYSSGPVFYSSTPGTTNPPSLFNWRTLGFGWRTGTITYMGMPPELTSRTVRVPDWFPVVAAGALAVLWFRHRRRRPPPGMCPACGYDLRASQHRCPECGTPIAAQVRDSTADAKP